MIPITLCALLLVPDTAKWLTGEYDLFDPLGIIATLGILFFFINPILHVYFDTWMIYVPPPHNDWRIWLGYMGWINLFGLIIYKWITARQIGQFIHLKTRWEINYKKVFGVFGLGLAIAFGVQAYVFARFGGILGYVEAYSSGSDAFAGMGWLFMISESFPILLVMLYAISAQHHPRMRAWKTIAFMFLIFFLCVMLFGGLRGSRSNVVWQCFWFAGIVHLWVRPLNKKMVIVSLIGLFTFLFVYGQYKAYGTQAFILFQNPELISEMAEQSGRTRTRTLLHDMGRSDVQAYVLYLLSDKSNYHYKLGGTYLSALTILLPNPLRPQLTGKAEAGFELITGMPSSGAGTTYVYGLAGEAMLNFGPIAIPFAFAVFAWVVSLFGNIIKTTERNDARTLFFPFIVTGLFGILTGDLGQLVFFVVKFGVVPFLVILACKRNEHATQDVLGA